MNLQRRLLIDDAGTTSVEYAVMLALLLATIIAGVSIFGGQTGTLFGETNQNLESHGFGS